MYGMVMYNTAPHHTRQLSTSPTNKHRRLLSHACPLSPSLLCLIPIITRLFHARVVPRSYPDTRFMVPSRFTPPFTPTQQKVLALIPKVTAVPSLVGSAYIIQHVLRKRQSQRKTYHRILLVMSAMDFLYALKCFMSTWAIPSELAIWGAGGSIRTCDAWGFLGHGASLSSAVYNGSLAIYFSLTIAFNCSERTLHRWYGEFFLHAVPLAVGWSTAIASLLLELNNPIVSFTVDFLYKLTLHYSPCSLSRWSVYVLMLCKYRAGHVGLVRTRRGADYQRRGRLPVKGVRFTRWMSTGGFFFMQNCGLSLSCAQSPWVSW